MQINQLRMSDFRQFYGENELMFGNEEKNITIIVGANGNGKTGIFRAVMFAMYGDQFISQDEKLRDLNLVNLDRLEELEGLPVKAFVELVIEFNNEEFLVRREVNAIKEGQKIHTNIGDLLVYSKDEFAEFNKLLDRPNDFIDRILEKEIRDFFFFDAEKMQLLETAKTSKNISKEVKNGIVRLLQINSMDRANKILKEMINEKKNDIKNKAKNIALDEKVGERENIEKELQDLEELRDAHISQKYEIQKLITNIEEKLSETEKIRQILSERDTEIRILQNNRSSFMEQKKDSRHLLAQMTHFLAQDLMDKNEEYLQRYQEEKNDKIPLELIEESLGACRCSLCASSISENSHQYKMLSQLKQEYGYSATTPIINSILRVNQKSRQDKPFVMKKVDKKIQTLKREESTIEQGERLIDQLNKEIESQVANQEDLKELERTVVKEKEKILELESLITKYEFTMNSNKKRISELDNEITNLMSKLNLVKSDIQVSVKLEKMEKILSETMESYTNESSKILSSEMTAMLYRLLDPKDQYIFKGVEINNDFEIKIFDSNGVNRLQDLSMGQGQIFTLSFILSLAKIASKGRSEINFPLFMDTPFARLSRKNRENLIKNIPGLVNQWILLLTDTELTEVERECFKVHGKTGKVYQLENQAGRTRIIQKNDLYELKMGGE